MEIGYGNTVGRIDLPLQGLAAPARYRLVVEVEGTTFANDWDLWVHPRAAQVATQVPSNVTIATQINAAMEAKLSAGETVWLMLAPSQIRGDADKGPIALGFSSIFWNTVWTNGQAPHSLGILCDPQDPALAGFPTDAYSNWQWWYPIKKGAAMILDGMPHELRPTIQVVDDWVTNRKLALALEAKAGRGRLWLRARAPAFDS